MSDYSFLIDQMTWSFSRLQEFRKCPYGFFSKYLLEEDEDETFLASFGSFVHEIHRMVFCGLIDRRDAASYFLENMRSRVSGSPPSDKIFASYYRGAFDYFSHMPTFDGEVFGVEKEFFFDVAGHPFHGFVDLITRTDEGFVIYDHKARNLKPFSGKKKPTKTDLELVEYYRQLYLYALALYQQCGEYPKRLVFNCYKNRTMITQEFDEAALLETINWATGTIEEIRSCQSWPPDIDYFKCRHLCGLNDRCEYKELM